MRLDRLGCVGRHFGRKRADLVRLTPQCAELFAPIGRLQFHDLTEVLSACQALGEVEAGIYVPLGDVDDFAVERCCALPRRIERFLKSRY